MMSRNAISDRRAIWASAVAGAVLSAVLLAGVWQFSQVQRSIDRQGLFSAAAFAERDRLLQIVNEETGIRGYVATSDPSYLGIYFSSLAQWAGDTASIARTEAALPRFAPGIRRSMDAAAAVQTFFTHEIALMRAHRTASAKAQLLRGRELVDRLRALDARVQADADSELNAQRVHTRFLVLAGMTVSIALSLIFVVWTLGFIVLLRRAGDYRLSSLRDPLTGAQNRRGAFAAIDAQIGAVRPKAFGIVFLDLDDFKKINDAYGHATGDELLRNLTARLQTELRPADTVCRLGGDEFLCVVTSATSIEQARVIAERLRRSVSRPYTIGNDSYIVGCSAGISMFPQHGTTAETLIDRADSAMYAAKHSGSGICEAPAAAP
ncbi:MAG TPA: diguanylate cyclase [Candidatus Baltobacteraceae bacterium]